MICYCQRNMEAQHPAIAVPPRIYAGFWLRVVATLLDAFVMFIPVGWVLTFTIIFIHVAFRMNDDIRAIVLIISLLLIPTLTLMIYSALMESSRWQGTVGKLVVGLHVGDLDGRRLTLGRSARRTVAKCLSTITIGIGYLLCGFTKRKQALHDIVAKCLVLRGRRPAS